MNLLMMILLWGYLLVVVPPCLAAYATSPCPSVFSYETSQPERDKWQGNVYLTTDESLVGVRIDVRLDRPAEILVSWMGTVSTDDNQRFTILSLDQRLHPGPPVVSRFMVRFNPAKGSPQVRTIRLNGRQICPPDPNFTADVQPISQGNVYENSYTTERVTRRPDLDFGEDWTASRPVTLAPKRPSYGSGEKGYSSHETAYSSQGDRHTGSSLTSQVGREPVSTYDSHESYQGDKTRRPSVSTSSTYNQTRGTDYSTASRPSISININKDVTYNVDSPEPDQLSYNGNDHRETIGGHRPSQPSLTHNPSSSNVNGYVKPTTKKPVVINSINININGGNDNEDEEPSYTPPKPTTKRPTVNNSKRNNTSSGSSSNRPTTRKPSSTVTQKPSPNTGYQGNRPTRNPEITTESHYNSRDKTTERNYHNNNKGSSHENTNNRPSSSESFRPNAVPSSRPESSGSQGKIPRPTNTGSKYGEEGNLESSNSNAQCGRVEVNPAPLITHGQNTARGQWPWHIALYRIEGINLSYSCGGSLITATVVITAAHCVTKAPRDRPVDADILVVQLGKYHLYQFSDDSVQNKQVRDVYVHPRYNSTNYLDDLALLVLSSPAEFTKFVRPVCLWPKHNFNLPSINNKEGTVVGWGYDENNQVTEELKMARMPVVSYVTCLKSYPQFFSQFTAENKTFCAGFRQAGLADPVAGTSVCNGDSGGGMVFQQDGRWYLRGLVSITVAKQGLRVCDTNHYVVFTDVANYVDWINQYT